MTLTAFLRENVYFPLGGSRKGRGRTYLNILVVYLVSGIWHGAGWTFILWGLLHGLAQVLERLWGKRLGRPCPQAPLGHDLPLYQPCVDLFPGAGYVLCPAFAETAVTGGWAGSACGW